MSELARYLKFDVLKARRAFPDNHAWTEEAMFIAGLLIAGDYDRDLFEEMLEAL